MERGEVRPFIDTIIYDFVTIGHLQEFRRNKESLLFVDHVCCRIEAFQQKSHEGSFDLNGVFGQDFWSRSLTSGFKVSDVRLKIADFSKDWSSVLDDDLQRLGYDEFISLLESWVLKNVSILEKRIKSDFQNKVEKIATWGLGLLVIAGVLVFTIFKIIDFVLHKDWGLKADYYASESFDRLIGTGYNRAINFSAPVEISKKFPGGFLSARWQGLLLVPKDGEYRISIEADDRASLFIDDQPFVTVEWPITKTLKNIILKQGSHKIVLEYVALGSPNYLKLSWDWPKGQDVIIAAEYLRH